MVQRIYDQSPMQNHLGIEHGAPNLDPPRNIQDLDVNFTDPRCKATVAGHLKRHVVSIHETVRYPCGQCDYKATIAGSLQKHVESVHEGVCYPCDQSCKTCINNARNCLECSETFPYKLDGSCY